MTHLESERLQPAQEQRLLELLEAGLPHCKYPYKTLARVIGANENAVMRCVLRWREEGLFRRFGLVIHHRNMGISANMMLALDVPDKNVHNVGHALAKEPDVTLCYRRRRQLPDWPYNLFCMVHGRDRDDVTSRVTAMLSRLGLDTLPHQRLFSVRAFKQRGARYSRLVDADNPLSTPTEATHERF